MPKKKSAKKKPPAAKTSDAAPPAAQQRVVVVEDSRDTKKLIFKGDGEEIDFERLGKRAPDAVQKLKAGEISPDDLAEELARIYTDKNSVGEDCVGADIFCFRLAVTAWPSSPESQEDMTEAEWEKLMDFSNDFSKKNEDEAESFFLSQQSLGVSEDDAWEAYYEWATKNLQKIFESTCRAWSTQLDRTYFNGETGAFLRSCLLYGLSQEQWETLFKEDHDSAVENERKTSRQASKVQEGARRAAYAVAIGADEVWNNCWQCGKHSAKDLKVCSRCSVARYCGHECQLDAWNGGHKRVCSKYKLHYQQLLEQLRIAETAHEVGTIHGIQPNLHFDHSVITTVINAKVTQETMILEPSLAHFHKNMGHIARGEWWVFSEPDSLQEFREKIEENGDVQLKMNRYLQEIRRVLCVDLHGFVASFSDGNVTSELIEAVLCGSKLMKLGAKMPAEYFLDFYGRQENTGLTKAQYRQQLSKYTKATLFRNLRECIENHDE